jgi:hypothetical protein
MHSTVLAGAYSLVIAPLLAGALAAQALPGRVVDVAASEYAFRAPDTIPAGLTTFRLRQEGRVKAAAHLPLAGRESLATHNGDATDGLHMLWVVRLDSGRTMADFYAAARADSSAPWARLLGGPGFAFPPRTTNATMSLEPGSYVLVCYVGSAREDRNRYHVLKGMFRSLTVVPSSAPAAGMPEPDVTVTMGPGSEVTFSTPIPRAGVWRILVLNRNSRRGPFAIRRVLAGHTAAEAQSWRRADGRPPVAEPWGGFATVGSGDSLLTTIDMIPGAYVANGATFVVAK